LRLFFAILAVEAFEREGREGFAKAAKEEAHYVTIVRKAP
jgi:hypothetical protein